MQSCICTKVFLRKDCRLTLGDGVRSAMVKDLNGVVINKRATTVRAVVRTIAVKWGQTIEFAAFLRIIVVVMLGSDMRLADYVIDFIAQQGVRHVFLVTGGGAMHLNDALAKHSGLSFVCCQHEQAAAIAAENYSKATGNLGVVMVTTGPGGTNAITGVAGAWLDSTPMLIISGQVKRADRMSGGVRQRGPQEVDIVSLVESVTKYAVTVTDPYKIIYCLERAMYFAYDGRPGPVWIDIPIDVQAAQVDPDTMGGYVEFLPRPGWISTTLQSRSVLDRLSRAERPLILAGNGIRLSGASEVFDQLVHALHIPVGLTWPAMDLLDGGDPLFIGKPGTLASRGANFALQNADFVLAIGARLDFSLTGWDIKQFAPKAYKVVVDINPAELRKLSSIIDKPVCADAGEFIAELLLESGRLSSKDRSPWLQRCRYWKSRYPIVQPEHCLPSGPVSMYLLSAVIGQKSSADDIIVSGSSGSAIEIFLMTHRARKGQRVFHTAGLGAMGYGLPAAIGACLGSGGKRTICVDGDGSFQFNIQELATAAHHRLPIKFFVLNNGGYSSIRATQKNYFGGANIGCNEATGLSIPDYCKVARAYGLETMVIEDQSDLRLSVRRALETPGPVVCDVHIIPDEARAPRVTSTQNPDGSFTSRPLEDLWPFLDREEFAENMNCGVEVTP